jgi:hypothetical protein
MNTSLKIGQSDVEDVTMAVVFNLRYLTNDLSQVGSKILCADSGFGRCVGTDRRGGVGSCNATPRSAVESNFDLSAFAGTCGVITIDNAITAGTWYVLVVEYNGNVINGTTFTLRAWLNGVNKISGFGGSYSTTTNSASVLIGHQSINNPNEQMNGNIGEVLIFNRTLTDNERTEVTRYLGTKWGVAVS